MNNNKININKPSLLLALGAVCLACVFVYYFEHSTQGMEVKAEIIKIHPQYVADFSDNKVLVGAAHNIFVGTVMKKIDTVELGIGPETQFEVKIIDNIKGELKDSVTVNQQGGYRDEKLYVVNGDLFTEGAEVESLLQIGTTYIFVTRYNEAEDWHTLISYPGANKILDSRESDIATLKKEAQRDGYVQELKETYPNEVYLESDITNDNRLNGYQSKETNKDEIIPKDSIQSESESEVVEPDSAEISTSTMQSEPDSETEVSTSTVSREESTSH